MNIPEGRKLPTHLENPIDNILLEICSLIHPLFYKLGFTANGITILSGILQVVAVVCLWRKQYLMAAVLYLVGYTFDVMDGYYARLYKMVSSYGDKLDHGKDTIVTIGLYAVVMLHTSIPIQWKVIFISTSITLSLLTAMYLGCQETYYSRLKGVSQSEFLSPFKQLCTTDDVAKLGWLRWFGTGTFAGFLTMYFVLLHVYINKK